MKIILFGSTGMLGRYVYNVLSSYFDVYCINRCDFDIENDELSKIYHILKETDIIINCAGIIPQKEKEDNLKKYIKVNTLFPQKLSLYSKVFDYKLIHITTDCVFDGTKGNYDINDTHTSNTIYGITKSLGEPEEATIIRTSIIGEEMYGKKSLIEWIISNKNKTINGYSNHYWNGITCLTLSNIIKEIIDTNNFWIGVKHIFSPDIVSKNDLCCYINEIYGLNINITDYNDKESRNMTLNGDIIFVEKTIFHQISELKHFNIY